MKKKKINSQKNSLSLKFIAEKSLDESKKANPP